MSATTRPASPRVTVALDFGDGKPDMSTTVTRGQWDELASLFNNDVSAIGAALENLIRDKRERPASA